MSPAPTTTHTHAARARYRPPPATRDPRHSPAQLVVVVAFVLVKHLYFQSLTERLHYTRLYAKRAKSHVNIVGKTKLNAQELQLNYQCYYCYKVAKIEKKRNTKITKL